MKKIIFNYYKQMKLIDQNFSWSNKYWWKDTNNAKVILAGNTDKPTGFCIVGYNQFIDDDVQSEICELFCKNPFAIVPLIRASIPYIKYPFGFQVLQNNHKAINCFEFILQKLEINYVKTPISNIDTNVYKYRIETKQTFDKI